MNTQSIVVYAVADYCSNLESTKMTFKNSSDLITVLELDQNDVSYHLRLYNDVVYPLYCDMDGSEDADAKPLEDVIKYFNDFFKTEIAITKSETTKKNSYHIVIKNCEATQQVQKAFFTTWNKDHPDYKVDTTVYSNNRLFRLPKQLKPYSGKHNNTLMPETRHIIMRGNMEDFLLQRYTGAQMLQIPEKVNNPSPLTPKANNNISDSSGTDMDKLIECLSSERATDYETWRNVGLCLRNIEKDQNDNLKYFIDFSKKYNLHDPEYQLAAKYLGFKPKEDKSNLATLRAWAKTDNPELYKQYFPSKCLITEDEQEPYYFTEWEKTHCKILNPPAYMEHKVSDDTEQFILRNTKALENSFNHLSIVTKLENKKGEIQEKKVSFIKTWTYLNDRIKLFDEIGIYPSPLVCPPKTYNCWTRFRGDLLPPTSQDYSNELNTFKFLLSILTGHEKTSTDYLEKWIAQAIQYPANKTTVPTIISKQGAGKGTLIKLITALLGDKKVLSTTKSDVVFGKFNSLMLDAYLVNLDELSPKDVKDVEHQIKGLITEPTLTVDIKGISPITIKSYHRFINTTNNEFGVFKTEEGDRRNFIVRASDELIGNKEFFTNFNDKIINNKEAVKFIYEYLKNIPNLDRFHEAANIPRTSYGDELKQCNRTDYDLWLEDFTKRNSEKGVDQFTSKALFTDFTLFIKKDNFNPKSFGIRIINIVSNGISKGKHTRDGETKVFNWKVLREHYKTVCLIDEDELSQASTDDLYINGILQAD